MVEYIELNEPLEKARVKKGMSEAQLANLQKGRDVKKQNQAKTVEDKSTKKMEDRFDRLLQMFEHVRLPPPEVQEALKVKSAPPSIPEEESESEEPEPEPEAPKRIEKPRARIIAQPDTKTIMLRFC